MLAFDDYPYAQIRAALDTLLGRLFIIVLASVAGSMLGGLTGFWRIEGLLAGMLGFLAMLPMSLFFGVGVFVCFVILMFAIAYIQAEWPLWVAVVCIPLMWWNSHGVFRAMKRSEDRTAKLIGEIKSSVEGSSKNGSVQFHIR